MRPVVLIIDDDLVSQYSTRYVVSQCAPDALIYVSDSAEEALIQLSQLQSARKALPDIIFLDLIMPGMGGWEFIKRFQKVPGLNKETRIYVLSAFTSVKDRDTAKNNSVIAGFFDKPITRNIVKSIFTSRTP
ncbi:response regulator [Sediminicola sp. 1XM1-17]|uniref:response regulator n=1 Tax=Sediminicola sp. 1XM1-17 TaxID=3127702 RepID=UPI0030789C6B